MKNKEIVSPITNKTLYNIYHNKFDVKSLINESNEKMEYVGETLERISKELLVELFSDMNISIKYRRFYAYIMREIMRNIPEHSEAERFTLMMYKNENEIGIYVVDNGITIKKSLDTNPKYNIYDDKSSIMFAIKPGITRSYKKDYLRDEVWQNSGFGLYMVSSLMKSLGYFEISSGTGRLKIIKDKNGFEVQSANKVNGTKILLIIDTRIRINISEMIKDLSNKGSRIAKESNFAGLCEIKTASQASTLIDES